MKVIKNIAFYGLPLTSVSNICARDLNVNLDEILKGRIPEAVNQFIDDGGEAKIPIDDMIKNAIKKIIGADLTEKLFKLINIVIKDDNKAAVNLLNEILFQVPEIKEGLSKKNGIHYKYEQKDDSENIIIMLMFY